MTAPVGLLGLAGSLLLGVALPPLNLWPLGWLAPVPWLLLIRRPTLDGRRSYFALWLMSLAFWLPVLYWLCLAHWTVTFGWLLLCAYLSIYLPLFVGLARVAVYRLQAPLAVAAPVVYVGLSWLQAHLFTGFSMAALPHTQYRWLHLIQCVDVTGEYGVTFVMLAVAAGIVATLPLHGQPTRWSGLVVAAVALGVPLAYGHLRLAQAELRPGPTVTIVQGNIDTELKFTEGEEQRVYDHYLELTQQAYTEQRQTDLIVWPETMFRYPLYTFAADAQAQPESPSIDSLRAAAADHRFGLSSLAQLFDANLLIGIDTLHFGRHHLLRYNSGLLVDRSGELVSRYDKSHPVMFGEWIPLVDRFPWLAHLSPIGRGIDAGARSSVMPLVWQGKTDYLSLSICYETVLPHVMRRLAQPQVVEPADAATLDPNAERHEPQLLVNLTNDGWFWGSHELDLHLICTVFRTVELRKPMLVAANTGFSAWIDTDGRVVRQGKRHQPDWFTAQVQFDRRDSCYRRYGDWFAGVCLLGTLIVAGFGLYGGWAARRRQS